MKAMVLRELCDLRKKFQPLELTDLPVPVPQPGEVLLKITACGVCHTELDEIEGRTPPFKLPVVLGHQVVGVVAGVGPGAFKHVAGDRVGVAWIYSSCGICSFCLSGNENLCPDFMATGRDVNGGYAEYITVNENFVHPIPVQFSAEEAAPLLCAGAIGYRSIRLAGNFFSDCKEEIPSTLGLTGFGASAHLVLKVARYVAPLTRIYVFARSHAERGFALELGATWAGDSGDESPEKLDVIIDTTPVWKPVVDALKNLKPGGRLVINAIRKENIDKEYLLNLDYPNHLWLEKEIKSVANVSRYDVRAFLELAAGIPLKPEIQVYPLEEANKALVELKQQKIRGAKVLLM